MGTEERSHNERKTSFWKPYVVGHMEEGVRKKGVGQVFSF
jgi:hypothetical protein